MSKIDLSTKTVADLRRIAKEYGVTLGQGINKAGIIAKLEDAILDDLDESDISSIPPAPAEPEDTDEDVVVEEEEQQEQPQPDNADAPAAAQPQVQFRAAWHNPSSRYSPKPSYPASRSAVPGAWSASRPVPPQDQPPRIGGTVRPANYTPRFGPEAGMQEPAQQQPPQQEDYRAYRGPESNRPVYPDRRASYDQRPMYDQRPPYDQRPSYDQRPVYDQRPSYDQRPAYDQRPSYDQRSPYDQRPAYDQGGYDGGYGARPSRYDQRGYAPRRPSGFYNAELGTSNPAVGDMLAAGECQDGAGVLEMHPDGYGFLRSDAFLPSSKDIYISMAQIKRFGLRTGDYVEGKTRPQRDGDKYVAMLYITGVNGISPDELGMRPIYDELTPIYPSRRVKLECSELKNDAMRLADLVSPLGFGQRGLILCPPEVEKATLVQSYANVITAANPDAQVMVLLMDETPEDVTLYREKIHCPVLASTFDLPPENHLRLADMVLERAQRLVEQHKDVVLVVDSLTRLSKTFTAAAAQQGRSMPGMVNPSSLFRAKKLFGAARCMKEGGSLTVIGIMNVGAGNKVDDAVVEEFRETANMELVLDGALARTGVRPPINLQLSYTKRAEMLLTEEQQANIQFLRSVLGNLQSAQAVPQLMSMVEKTQTNDELLAKLHDWVALMEGGRPVANT